MSCYPASVRPSIPSKVFAAFVVLLLVFGAVSGFMMWRLQSLGTDVVRLHATLLPLPSLVAELRSELAGLDLLLNTDAGGLARAVHIARRVHPYLDRIDDAHAHASAITIGQDLPEAAAPVVEQLQRFDALHRTLRDAVEALFDAVENEAPAAELAGKRRSAQTALRTAGRATEALGRDLDRALDTAVLGITIEEQRARWGGIVLAALGMVLGVLVTLSTSRLLAPLATLREAVERVARGEYEAAVINEMPGEFGELATEFNRMAEAIRGRDAQLNTQQKELLHQERLATVGHMSAQITHELRNPLTSIGLNSELLMEELDLAKNGDADNDATLGDARSLLVNIIREVDRLKEITEEYLRFARLPRPEQVPVDLNLLAADLIAFVRSELERAGVRIRLDADTHGRPALVDPNQVRAALLNLVRNAREACEAKDGHIVVRVRTLGDHATLAVEDDGPGMTDKVLERLMEPFFSTKPQGTGLGLPMVSKIVQAQHGDLRIESELGKGTTVVLTLPLARMQSAEPA
jgi:signal transduction histidine kinase